MKSESRGSRCGSCDGRGFTLTVMHYTRYGVSPVTYCRRCPRGRELLRAWTREPKQVAYNRRLKTDRVRRTLELSCLGDQFAGRRLDHLVGEPTLHEACSSYVTDWPSFRRRGDGFYFWGPVGRGKTHAAAVLVNELIERHLVETLFLSVPEAAAQLRKALKEQDLDTRPDLLDRMKQAELLVLDDLGVEKPSAWVGELLYRVIDHRWRARLPMVITSSLSLTQLERRYPPQIASRLDDCCRALQVTGGRARTPRPHRAS